ncbi:MAG: cobalamin biosynthesis protein [Ruminococcus sp.]|nr:cobalamin biosynthesis protein [Ruminococcus sp.]
MRISIISVTEKGRKLSLRLCELLEERHTVKRYCHLKHGDGLSEAYDSIHSLTERLFTVSDALIYICASGIAVRSIAPFIRSKTSDPAVIVIDDCGKYIIPILSGHIGGANRIAEIIAAQTGAAAVITTATDIGGVFSPDSFAAANNLIVTDLKAAKAAAATVLDGEKIGFASDYEHINMPEQFFSESASRIGICVSADSKRRPFDITLNLVPKNIVLGIGCKKNTPTELIERRISETFNACGLDMERICCISTIDIKAREEGIVSYCRKRKLELHSFSAAELMAAEGDFEKSEFVLKTTGTDNVCERSAVLCSGGKIIIRKNAADGVTLAAAEMPVNLDFERKEL